MTKEKFLKSLEKKLNVLSEEEKNDIIAEYQDIIDEKIKHGKTEEEAIKEFGDINELSKEILSAYKINPEYSDNDKNKNVLDDCEDLIKKGAKKLTEVTEEVANNIKTSNVDFTMEKVFELVIKFVIVLLLLAVLKIPFYIISEIGEGIFNIGFAPFNHITTSIWKLLVEIVYLALCILIIFTLINKWIKENTKEIKEESKEYKKDDNIEPKKKVKNNSIKNLILIIIKIFVCITILFPLLFSIVGMIFALVFIVYLLIKGIEIYGILILLAGIIGLFIFLADLIYGILFKNKVPCIWTVLINIILIGVGSLMTFDYFISFEYINDLPQDNYKFDSIIYEENITKNTTINNNNVDIEIDNSLEDNKIKIKVEYYKEFYDIEKEIVYDKESDYIYFHYVYANKKFSFNDGVTNDIINDIKNKKIYNYSLLSDIKVTVYTNDNTKDLIK